MTHHHHDDHHDDLTLPTIHIDGLVKDFGRTRALDGLDLEVRRGEVHGFLGPNGAGKTTTLRIVLGLIRATAGRVELFGRDPWAQAPRLHERLAAVAGDVALWPGLTAGQCLDVLGAVQGRTDPRRRAELVERFDLDPTKRIRDASKGNRQKVALIAALAADVELLVLDEPTSGLDPLMEQVFQDCVRARRRAGCTVLLSSHILDEVEALADRVSIVRHGRTIVTGSLAELRTHTRTTVHAVTEQAPVGLDDVPGVAEHTAEPLDGSVDTRLTVDGEHIDDIVGRLHAARIRTLTVTPPSLDAVFLQRYQDDPEDDRGDRGDRVDAAAAATVRGAR